MKCRTQVGLAIGAGYLLGRRRKRGLALAVGTAALTGGLGSAGSRLLRKGMAQAPVGDLLGKLSPEAEEMVGMVRGELLDLGRTAVRTAVNSQLESLTGKLHGQAEALRGRLGETGGAAAGEAAGRVTDLAGRGRRRAAGEEPEDEAGGEEPADDEWREDEEEPAGGQRREDEEEPAEDQRREDGQRPAEDGSTAARRGRAAPAPRRPRRPRDQAAATPAPRRRAPRREGQDAPPIRRTRRSTS